MGRELWRRLEPSSSMTWAMLALVKVLLHDLAGVEWGCGARMAR